MTSPTRLFLGFSLVAFAGCATFNLAEVPFALGQQQFGPGDAIVIEHVRSSSPDWAIGDTVEIQGQYVLASQRAAMLSVYMTTRSPGSSTSSDGGGRKEVALGSGRFDLTYQIQATGELHVSFYPVGGGSSFGGVYFGPDVSKP